MDKLEQEFLRDICEHPKDDVPRLVYCDWLEENGQDDRARFIRLGIEFSQFYPIGIDHGIHEWADWCRVEMGKLARPEWVEPLACVMGVETKEVKTHPDGKKIYKDFGTEGITLNWKHPDRVIVCDIAWNRGFVSKMVMEWDVWYLFGPAIVRTVPIDQAVLRNAQPGETEAVNLTPPKASSWWRWEWGHGMLESTTDRIPSRIWRLMADFDPACKKYQGQALYESKQAALEGLSRALIRDAWER